MLTLRVCADDNRIPLQDLDTDDFENCNVAKKFTSETNENMEKLVSDIKTIQTTRKLNYFAFIICEIF